MEHSFYCFFLLTLCYIYIHVFAFIGTEAKMIELLVKKYYHLNEYICK